MTVRGDFVVPGWGGWLVGVGWVWGWGGDEVLWVALQRGGEGGGWSCAPLMAAGTASAIAGVVCLEDSSPSEWQGSEAGTGLWSPIRTWRASERHTAGAPPSRAQAAARARGSRLAGGAGEATCLSAACVSSAHCCRSQRTAA